MNAIRRPTRGWLVTRLETAVALLAIVVALAAPAISSWYEPMFGRGIPNLHVAWLIGVGSTVVGAVRLFRIARRDPESGRSSWRYREF